MKKYWLIPVILFFSVATAYPQTAVDALRYSRLNIGGTARYMSMGGAFGALGADFTSMSTNPGGIGLYTSSEFSITPSIFIGKTESSYNGSIASDQRSNFNLGNVGLVFASPISSRNGSGWKYFQFATGLTRLADFNNRIEITGPNHQNSLLDIYVNDANGTYYKDIENDPNGYYAYDLNLAWWTFLINPANADSTMYSSVIPYGGTVQSKNINTHGSMNEYDFSFAANYMDKLYIGMTIGIPMIRYFEDAVYSETDVADTIYDFSSFKRIESLETRGTGFNFKFGFIYRVTDWFRFGAAFHTPSFFTNMKDIYNVTMQSYFDNGDNYTRSAPQGNYLYNLNTPLRASGSLAFIIGNRGLVSADYEYVDYTSARFSSNSYNYSFGDVNSTIRNSYAASHNIRIGTEWRYNIFSFRGGFNYSTSPYSNNINDGKRIGFSGGVGFRQGPFFMDLAYVYSRMWEDYYLYNRESYTTAPSNNKLVTNSILLTVGTRF